MKKIIVLFSLTACCAAPLSAQNSTGSEHQKPRVIVVKAKAPVPERDRVVYTIYSFPVTGSHIPLVMRQYHGERSVLGTTSPGAGYGSVALGHTDSMDVKGALLQLDPALSSASH